MSGSPDDHVHHAASSQAQPEDDWSNLIALGVLCVPSDAIGTEAESDWKRLVDFRRLLSLGHPACGALHQLAGRQKLVITYRVDQNNLQQALLRIYVRADDKCTIDSSAKRRILIDYPLLMSQLDGSAAAWSGQYETPSHPHPTPMSTDAGRSPLFRFFNSLPSPRPCLSELPKWYTKEAMTTILSSTQPMPGLLTQLYPYQQRSAAMMIQREEAPNSFVDPRLEMKTAADGRQFYYDPDQGQMLLAPHVYPGCRGGILAETMGLGWVIHPTC